MIAFHFSYDLNPLWYGDVTYWGRGINKRSSKPFPGLDGVDYNVGKCEIAVLSFVLKSEISESTGSLARAPCQGENPVRVAWFASQVLNWHQIPLTTSATVGNTC